MTTDPKRVKEIFLEAAELEDEVARTAHLDRACGNDAGLRARVEALLRNHDPDGSFLGTPAAVVHEPDHATPQPFAADANAAVASGTDPAATQNLSRARDAAPAGRDSTGTATEEEPLTFLAPPQRPDSLGRIGHYEVLQILGRGGFGIVFRAFDEMLQRVVALKVMAPQLAATSPARKRFLREARSSAQIRHENVVQVYEVVEQPLPYLAMEFIPGETLQQKLDRLGPLEVAEILQIGRQIAEGLAAAHATDLIHRDIKPGNVLLEGGHHKVKITDFGLARAADDASISQSVIIAGTPMYMAPEQAKGEKIDQRADLFSLGSVLYQMVAGRPPFRANSAVAVLKRVAEDKPRAIREIIPETPQWLCDIIAKLHAKDPNDRYQSAREVSDVLADCEAQLKANAKLKDYSRIPRSKPAAGRTGWWKWVVAAAVLLPVVALALAESAGITHVLHGRKPDDKAPPRNQQATVAPLKPGDPEYTNTLGMQFKLIPAGKFTMGSPKEEIDRCLKQPGPYKGNLPTEGPEHPVEITRPFYLGATEVTVGQFRQFVDEEAYQVGDGRWRNPRFDQTDQHPVVFVSWNNAVDFSKWLSKKEGKEYRLPTEAEWEYSCRAGKAGSRYGFGDDDAQLKDYAWFDQNSGGGTHPVGKKKPNAWGLYDMHGNAWEWCQDNYDPAYYKNSPVKDPPGGAGGGRAGRGGGWLHGPVLCRSANRGYLGPDDHVGAGFRVLLVSPPAGVGTESEAKDKPAPTIAPFTDADVQRIAALPAAEQVTEVRKELMRRNPGFDGKVRHRIEDGVVTEFRIVTDQVTDIAPIRVFNALRVLDCSGMWTGKSNGILTDLTPLEGMNLAGLKYLKLADTKVTDAAMVYFKNCKNLTELSLNSTSVTDAGLVYFKDCKNLTCLRLAASQVTEVGLAHFKDCKNLAELWLHASWGVSDAGLAHFKDCKKLTCLILNDTHVSDVGLALFSGTPLTVLSIFNTDITDLTALQGMPLEHIRLTPKNIVKGLEILREMKSLKRIGIGMNQVWPAAEFWERYDDGEFK